MNDVYVHPLFNLQPIAFQSFSEWKGRWDSTRVLGEKFGLLHCVQIMECWPETRQDFVFFLLDVANGYRTGSPFHDWRGYGCNETNKALDAISRKAFDVLCVKLFAPGKEGYAPYWWWMLEKQETFDKLLSFCLPEAKNYMPPYEGEKVSHQTEVFGSFLEDFSQLGWTYDENEEGTRLRLIAARPQFIEILRRIRQLNWLNKPMRDFGREFPELDEPCLKKLRDMAFEESWRLPTEDCASDHFGSRKPKTLHEAILGGSAAAEILIMDSIRKKEKKRIAALYEESLRKREALERQQRLEEIRKAKAVLEKQEAQFALGSSS